MDPILKKLFFKGQNPVLILSAPKEFEKTLRNFGVSIHKTPQGTYDFILAFALSLKDALKIAKTLSKSLPKGGIFWMAYPKGTSKKYQADINRDTGYALMKKNGFTGVSLVAIDEDWSAMRFKGQEKKRPLPRNKNRISGKKVNPATWKTNRPLRRLPRN
jgi:hypothetical protein